VIGTGGIALVILIVLPAVVTVTTTPLLPWGAERPLSPRQV